MSLRVAFVMPGVGIYERGAEVFVTKLTRALIDEHRFDVCVFGRGATSVPHRVVKAIPRDDPWTNRIYLWNRLLRKVIDTLYLDPLDLELYSVAISSWSELRRWSPHVVVMEGGLVGAWLCRWLRFRHGIPFVDIAHGNSRRWEWALARQRPDRVVVFSTAAAMMIREGVPGARIEVIPHGVELSQFHPGVEPMAVDLPRPIVLCAGAVEPVKRMEHTVAAMRALGRGSLLVLGDGSGAAELDRLALDALGPERYLRRQVPQAEMPAWYCAADVVTLASHTEAFGLVYLEALASGRPCVAPDDSVRREVLGDAAVLYPADDVTAYAKALAEALDRDWGDVPRRRAERLSFATTVSSYARLLREVVEGASGP